LGNQESLVVPAPFVTTNPRKEHARESLKIIKDRFTKMKLKRNMKYYILGLYVGKKVVCGMTVEKHENFQYVITWIGTIAKLQRKSYASQLVAFWNAQFRKIHAQHPEAKSFVQSLDICHCLQCQTFPTMNPFWYKKQYTLEIDCSSRNGKFRVDAHLFNRDSHNTTLLQLEW